jgi:hypothetical protein
MPEIPTFLDRRKQATSANRAAINTASAEQSSSAVQA